jgi:hypothetical protein
VILRVFIPHRRVLAFVIPDARVQVERRAGLLHGVLGHEGDVPPVEVGDLLDTVLVDGVPVRHLEGVSETKVDLLLPAAEFALREFDRNRRSVHAVADLTDQVFITGRLKDVVILDMRAMRNEVLVPLVARLFERILEQEELQFGSAHERVTSVARALDLSLEDLSRRDVHDVPFFCIDIADHQRRLLEPWDDPERGHVGEAMEIAVAQIPIGVPVVGQRLHVHVHRKEIVAPVHPLVAGHLLHEERTGDTFSHEPAL